MKTIVISTAFLLAFSTAWGAQPAAKPAAKPAAESESEDSKGKHSIEMRPTDKRSLALKDSERNPYAKRSVQDEIDETAEQNSEEIAIRKKLSELSVAGSSHGRQGLRLLLGDILIQRGIVIPPLLANQTHHLKVIDLTSNKIILGWLDIETGALTGKTLQINYDLAPTVQYVLQGQGSSTARKSQEMGLLRPQGRPAQQEQLLIK